MRKDIFASAVLVAALSSGAVMAGGGGSGAKGGGQGAMQGGGYGQMTQQKSSPSYQQSGGSAWEVQAREQQRLQLEQHEGAKSMDGDHAATQTRTQDRQ